MKIERYNVIYRNNNGELVYMGGETIEKLFYSLYPSMCGVSFEKGQDFNSHIREDGKKIIDIQEKNAKYYIGNYGNEKYELVERGIGYFSGQICKGSKKEIMDICSEIGIIYEDLSK